LRTRLQERITFVKLGSNCIITLHRFGAATYCRHQVKKGTQKNYLLGPRLIQSQTEVWECLDYGQNLKEETDRM